MINEANSMKQALLFLFLIVSHLVLAQDAEHDATFLISGTGFNGRVNALAVQDDGKIVVGGDFTQYDATTRNYIARLNSDGTLDDTFDAGTTLGAAVLAIAIDDNDNIVVGGSFSASVKRLTPTGASDGTFVLDGTGLNGLVTTLAIDGDGNIVIGGNFTSYNGISRNYIARLLASGDLDTNFEPGTGFNGFLRKIGIQSDGKIVAVGGSSGFSIYNGTSRDNIARIESTGALDLTFVPPTNLLARLYDVKFQSDNKIIVTGEYNGNLNSIFYGIARLNTDGSLDESFTPNFFQGGRSLHIQSNGTIVVGGLFSAAIKLINADGTPNPFFDGRIVGSAAGPEITSIVNQDNKILAAGLLTSFHGFERVNMMRITTCEDIGITTQPETKTACESNDVSFSTVATGSGLTYQWQVREPVEPTLFTDLADGGGVSGTQTSTLSLNAVTTSLHNNHYRVVITGGTCSTTTDAVVLYVVAAPVINTHPSSQDVCVGASTSFSVSFTGTGPVQWQSDSGAGFVDIVSGGQYTGATTTTLSINSTTEDLDGMKFRCRVGDCDPGVYSNEAELSVSPGPTVNSESSPVYTCAGNDVIFEVTATNATSYQWQEKVPAGDFTDLTDGNIYSGTATSVLTLSGVGASQNGNYYRCVVSGAGSCSVNSFQRLVGVYSTPVVATQPVSVTTCAGTAASFSVQITDAPAGLSYQWQERVGEGSFVNLTNSGGYNNTTSSTMTIDAVTAQLNGKTYRCIIGNCSTAVLSSEADLTVETLAVITQGPVAVQVCPGEYATFSVVAEGNDLSYEWTVTTGAGTSFILDGGDYSGASTSTLTISNVTTAYHGFRYRAFVTNGSCNDVATANVLLSVAQTPSITGSTGDRITCEGGTTTFSVTATNSSDTYQWEVDFTGLGYVDVVDGSVYSGATTRTLTINGAPISFNGNKYRCKVGVCTPATSTQASLTVNQTVTITSQPVDRLVCDGSTTTFEVSAIGTSLTYQWLVDGGIPVNNPAYSGLTTPTLTVNTGSGAYGSKYQCQVIGTGGCGVVLSAETTLTVQVIATHSDPVAVAAFCEGGNATYNITASGPNLTYQWQSSNGTGFSNVSDGGVYSGATSASLTITGAPFSMNGNKFRCVVSGDCPGATSGEVTLLVNQIPAKPTIAIDFSNPESPLLTTQSTAQTYSWFLDGTLVSQAASFIATAEGSYTVKVSSNGCESPLSDPKVIAVTGVFTHNENTVRLYPNPAKHTLVISLSEFDPQADVDIAMIDFLGRTIARTSGAGGSEKVIDVSTYQAGRYVVRLGQGPRQISSSFIKQNQ
jgi:uncharacterized delta-60 repeat protein